jgi:hypothetical protein
MRDADLDREIAAALGVEPSAEFVARVRQSIAAETIAPPWSFASWMAGAVAAVAIAIAAAVVLHVERGIQPSDAPAAPARSIDSRPVGGIARLQGDRRSGRLPAGDRPVSRISSHATGDGRFTPPAIAQLRLLQADTPEVLIDVREANALRALFAGAALGRLHLTPVVVSASAVSSDPQPLPEIDVAPLSIQPLAPEPGEGERP